jgi:hypothetical protein
MILMHLLYTFVFWVPVQLDFISNALDVVLSATYYLELRDAIIIYYMSQILLTKVKTFV